MDPGERIIRLETRVDELDRRMASLDSIAAQMATVNSNLGHMDRDLTILRDEVEGITATINKRDEAVSKERRETRLALYTMIGLLGASAIAAIGTVLVGLLGG
ncbi:hypothetical protein [Mycobacterium sp.]|uniref:hypothetical protein n=1 Tax=Mycobacterium sp. TaxID=1785 RepID=UPI002617987E|nr:hypothetical protein [Mycobacterium sp.]